MPCPTPGCEFGAGHEPDHPCGQRVASTLRVRLDELLPIKTASRALPAALDRLERREVEHLVITRRNEPRAVLISVERYELLLAETARPTAYEQFCSTLSPIDPETFGPPSSRNEAES